MMDIYKWFVIIAGLSILLNLAGLPTGATYVLDYVGEDIINNPENINFGNLIITITALFALASTIGIAVGYITKTSGVETMLSIGYVIALLSFVSDGVRITIYAFSLTTWVGWITLLIFFPLSLGYLHSLVSWWAGRS